MELERSLEELDSAKALSTEASPSVEADSIAEQAEAMDTQSTEDQGGSVNSKSTITSIDGINSLNIEKDLAGPNSDVTADASSVVKELDSTESGMVTTDTPSSEVEVPEPDGANKEFEKEDSAGLGQATSTLDLVPMAVNTEIPNQKTTQEDSSSSKGTSDTSDREIKDEEHKEVVDKIEKVSSDIGSDAMDVETVVVSEGTDTKKDDILNQSPNKTCNGGEKQQKTNVNVTTEAMDVDLEPDVIKPDLDTAKPVGTCQSPFKTDSNSDICAKLNTSILEAASTNAASGSSGLSPSSPKPNGKTRPVAVKRIRDVRPEALPPNVTASITIGKPFFSLGGRRIETAVPRAGRRRESGTESKSSSSMSKCINENCSALNTEFVKAPPHAVLFYGYVPIEGKNRYKVCKICLDNSSTYLEKTKEALKSESTIFDVPVCGTANPCSTVFLEVSDPESDEDDVLEDIELDDDIPDDLGVDQILEEMLGNLRIKSQVEACVEKLTKEADDIDFGFEAADDLLEQADIELETVRQEFQNFCGPTYNSIVLKSVEIDPSGKMTTLNSTDAETQEILAANARNRSNARKMKSEMKQMLNKQEVKSIATTTTNTTPVTPATPATTTPSEPVPVDEVKELKQVCQPDVERVLAATPTVIPRIMPKVGDAVFGMKNNALSFWILGKILEVIRNTINGQLEYKVQFEIPKKGKSGNIKEVVHQIKNMNPKHISYNLPCPFVLPVGTRVIALFKDEFKNEPVGANNYYAGIVAEPPKNTNTYRYLIFFDDGFAQYCSHDDVLLVCEASKDVWNDVHPDTQDFVKNYILKYPERPMVRLQKGTMMSTEWNGNWWIARVVEVDCSLVKIFFEEDNRYEWIYRGSTRLAPLYTKARGLEIGPSSSVPRRQNRAFNPSYQKPVIEYTYEEQQPAAFKGMQTARKSTSAPPSRGPPQLSSPDKRVTSKPLQKSAGARACGDLVEYEGTITKIIITDVKGPIPFVPHLCKPTCVRAFTESDAEIRKINPLSLPLYLGWAREVGKTPKRTIFYRAPCGRRLRDFDDLHVFLRDTKYNMGIDYFCFDYSVDCLSEFVATRQHFQLRDISYGKEVVPVQCVNSVDHDYPEYVEYTRNRLPGKGVKINLDEEFLTCCDCTDDCSDKTKCSCWQLTIEGTNLGKDTMNLEVGYQNRRLIDHVVSGIYECNSRCKCRTTCSNRVVQNDLKWQLQIFKTGTKGWAIRPLHDIPQGAFICVYAGQLLTEQGANEDGKAYGDEYLAELDYIEVIESVKEGYEAEAIEDDNRRGGGLQDRRRRRYQAYMDADDDDYSGEEDDHSKDTDFVVRLPGNKAAGSRSQDSDHRKPKKSSLYDDTFDTSYARKPTHLNANPDSGSEDEDSSKLSTRSLFGPDEQCYIMDAKSIGNIGRYLNHSCSPNVFVQNVFVDTHDIRFPWVAFFAYKHIRAGTELTWDYNYDIGSVPGKVMYCHCSSPDCRGRLL